MYTKVQTMQHGRAEREYPALIHAEIVSPLGKVFKRWLVFITHVLKKKGRCWSFHLKLNSKYTALTKQTLALPTSRNIDPDQPKSVSKKASGN